MREAVAPQLSEHPAHHGYSVDEDAAITANASTALEATCRGEVLAWAASDHQNQCARREAGSEVPEWPLTGGALVFPDAIPDIPCGSPVLGLPSQVGASCPAAFHGSGEIIILFSKHRGVQESADAVSSKGIDQNIDRDPCQPRPIEEADKSNRAEFTDGGQRGGPCRMGVQSPGCV